MSYSEMTDKELNKEPLTAQTISEISKRLKEWLEGGFIKTVEDCNVLKGLLENIRDGLHDFIMEPSDSGYAMFHEAYFDDYFPGAVNWPTVVRWAIPALEGKGFNAKQITFFTNVEDKNDIRRGFHVDVEGFELKQEDYPRFEFYYTGDVVEEYIYWLEKGDE